ncbi:ABC transporter substrate-binding protein [soil metagenome]
MRPVVLAAGLAGLVVAAGAATAQERLTIYTSQPTEQMDEVIALFNEEHPGIEVELFRSGTTEVMNRLLTEVEAGAPQADVLLIADTVAMTQVKEMGLLMPYEDAPVEGLAEGQYDPDMTFFGTKLITTGIVYNTAADVPRPESWNDLLAEEARDQVVMPSPLYSGAAVIHVGTLANSDGFGWDYLEGLQENGAIAVRGNGGVRDAVARGERAYGVLIDYMAFGAAAEGSPVEFVFPEEGVTVINQPVGILNTSENVEAARTFVDFQLSRSAQALSVEQLYFPLIEGLAPPEGYPDPAELSFIEVDPATILEQTDEIMSRFADLFGG